MPDIYIYPPSAIRSVCIYKNFYIDILKNLGNVIIFFLSKNVGNMSAAAARYTRKTSIDFDVLITRNGNVCGEISIYYSNEMECVIW